jgi:hypothetical protein
MNITENFYIYSYVHANTLIWTYKQNKDDDDAK